MKPETLALGALAQGFYLDCKTWGSTDSEQRPTAPGGSWELGALTQSS